MVDYMSRMPQISRSGKTVERFSVEGRIPQNELPEIGRLVLAVVRQSGKDQQTLTAAQLAKLRRPVFIPGNPEPYPSPEEELRMFGDLFRDFISKKVILIPALSHRGSKVLSGQSVVNAICGYHWKGGWLQFRPKQEILTVRTATPFEAAQKAGLIDDDEL